jgi:hypothetical protein
LGQISGLLFQLFEPPTLERQRFPSEPWKRIPADGERLGYLRGSVPSPCHPLAVLAIVHTTPQALKRLELRR